MERADIAFFQTIRHFPVYFNLVPYGLYCYITHFHNNILKHTHKLQLADCHLFFRVWLNCENVNKPQNRGVGFFFLLPLVQKWPPSLHLLKSTLHKSLSTGMTQESRDPLIAASWSSASYSPLSSPGNALPLVTQSACFTWYKYLVSLSVCLSFQTFSNDTNI